MDLGVVMVECNLMMDATQVCARFTRHALVVLFPLKFVIISMAKLYGETRMVEMED